MGVVDYEGNHCLFHSSRLCITLPFQLKKFQKTGKSGPSSTLPQNGHVTAEGTNGKVLRIVNLNSQTPYALQ